MANATFDILEYRCLIKPEWTELYIRTGPASDGTLGVGGWYKKYFPPSVPSLPALDHAIRTACFITEWDRGAPPDRAEPPMSTHIKAIHDYGSPRAG